MPLHTVKTGAERPPFKTIILMASLALTLSACETMRPHKADDRQASTAKTQAQYAHLEPKEAALALFDQGQALIQQGKKQEAFAVLDELDRRFGQDPRSSVRALLARALSLKAQTASTPTESLAAQIEISRRYGEDIDPTLRKQIVTSMFDQAANLGKEGNLSAAIPIYKEIEQIYSDGKDSDRSWGVWAIFYQADLQRQLRNPRAAVASYERLDQRFGQETDPTLRPIIADALFKKAETLTEQGDTRAAIAAYDEIDYRYAKDRDPAFRQRAVRALFAKGSLLGKQGMGEEPDNEAPIVNLRPTGDTVAAVAVYDDIVQRFGHDKDPTIHNMVGGTLLKKSEALRLVGDDQGTVAVYDEIVTRFGNDETQVSRVLVATALFRKGMALGKQEGAAPQGIESFDEIVRRFGSDSHPNVRKIVGQAIAARKRLTAATEPMHDN